MTMQYKTIMPLLLAGTLAACTGGGADSSSFAARDAEVFEGPVPPAVCGPGSMPETGLQGQVSIEDRESGRSASGYSCNMELVGQYQGQGASWQHAWFEDCAYYDQAFSAPASSAADPTGGAVLPLEHPGVVVVDVEDPTKPRFSTNLTTPAMLDPWESLKVNEKRGLLGAVAGWNGLGPVYFDVYDLNEDCAHPKLASSSPVQLPVGHEGEFSFDGMTYYGTGTLTPSWTAIDVSNPALPVTIFALPYPNLNHGLATSEDGNRIYAADLLGSAAGGGLGSGMSIWDVTGVQSRTTRTPLPISSITWPDGSLAQHTIPISYGETPYVIAVDEGGQGAARIIDVSDEVNPRVISKLKLEIHMPENAAHVAADTVGAGGFTYQGHYCGVDRRRDPTVVGCGYFQSGLRVFDIRDPYRPREIGYYNPPAVGTSPPGSNRGGTANSGYSSSQVRFIEERGEVWFTDQDNGFMVVRFTNGAWPF